MVQTGSCRPRWAVQVDTTREAPPHQGIPGRLSPVGVWARYSEQIQRGALGGSREPEKPWRGSPRSTERLAAPGLEGGRLPPPDPLLSAGLPALPPPVRVHPSRES